MWYLSQKLPDGSFPGNTTSSYGYVRGTGKIFEVLALHDEYTESRYHDTLAWFYTMQYTPSNTFFVQENIRKEMYGGFRHDYVNSSVWIDANAHVLIGIARILGRT
jgi:hypothetical protein